jgi:anti-sigma regulatory factor (Ser/Thr protein kinase)
MLVGQGDQGAGPTRRQVSRWFERNASEVGPARRFVRSNLDRWGFSAQAQALELAVSELVSNAVLHGDGAIQVALWSDGGHIRLEVTDEGQPADPPRPVERSEADDREPGGWGLRLVDELADRWGAAVDPGHTRVWMVKDTDDTGERGEGTDAAAGPR